MGRGKIEIRRIENSISRQVTFSKRRKGLLKKAHELSVLCDAQIGLVIFSERGKMKEFCSNPPNSMGDIIERYCRANNIGMEDIEQQVCAEMMRIRRQDDEMAVRVKWCTGQDLVGRSMDDLTRLEEQLEVSVSKVRSRKKLLLRQQLETLRRRALQLEDENNRYRHAIEQHQASAEFMLVEEGRMTVEGNIPYFPCDNPRDLLRLSPPFQGFHLQPGDVQEFLSLQRQGF